MADIFISYSRNDKDHASNLAEVLTSLGYTVWWDREILAGQDFTSVIQSELKTSKCVLTIWTESSVISRWVQDESRVALEYKKFVPVFFEDVNLPLPFGSIHTESLKNWKGDIRDINFNKILSAIELYTNKKPFKVRNNSVGIIISKKIVVFVSILLTSLGLYYFNYNYEYTIEIDKSTCFSSKVLHHVGRNLDLENSLIQAGDYVVGKISTRIDTTRKVHTESFLIDSFEVTNKQYYKYILTNKINILHKNFPIGWSSSGFREKEDFYPVRGISWDDAKKYCLSIGKNLPSASEWEIACRYGATTKTKNSTCNEAKIVGNYNGKKSEIFNIQDNVSEWTRDIKEEKQDSSKFRVRVKGNNYTFTKLSCSDSLLIDPSDKSEEFGFRCIKKL